MAEAIFRIIAKTLEAFDEGYIDAEDDLTDLDDILAQKVPKAPSQRSLFDAPNRPTNRKYRYLMREDNSSSRSSASSGCLSFARKEVQMKTPRSQLANAFQRKNPLHGLLDGSKDEDLVRTTIEAEPRFACSGSAVEDAIEVSSESDSE